MEEIKVGMSTKEFTENLEVFNNTGEHIDNPKEGDYIRTIDGYIRRIAKVNTERKAITYSGTYILDKPYKNSKNVARNKIKKFSQDILDLIEPYDLFKKEDAFNWYVYFTEESVKEAINILKEEKQQIKSICTKEQFAAAEYKVEE